MNDTPSLTRAVAEYAAGFRLTDGSLASQRDRARQLLLDFLGVALGGRTLAESSPALLRGLRAIAGGSGGACTLIGEEAGFSAPVAALGNAALAHSMDFDDTHRDSIMHIGAPVFASLLAASELTGAAARQLLEAALVGYEAGGRLGRAHGDRVHLRGFHPTATTGVFAATAACGRLLGLPVGAIESALGLALSMASGTQQFSQGGGANKPVQVGMAAHNALYSALLAREGVPGAAMALEGAFGYYAVFAEPGSSLTEIRLDAEPREVLEVAIKPYPCCRYSHGTIDALTGLVAREGLVADEIESIEVEVPRAGFQLIGADPDAKRQPGSVVEAQFSAYFAAAVAVTQGHYDWYSYTLLDDAAVRAMMRRVSVRSAEDLTGFQTRLHVRASGATRRLAVPYPKGEPELPLSWQEVEAKFLMLARPLLGDQRARQVVALVRRLESLDSVAGLTALLRPATVTAQPASTLTA